jgi:phosphatidylethanolamine/phosphatidyl-N-methylethanolamine N-methyltransferase
MFRARSTAAFYDRLAVWYPLIEVFFRTSKAALGQRLDALPPTDLLDLGAGDGSSFKWYAPHRITAVELSSVMLKKARLKAPTGSRLQLGDIHNLPFPDYTFGIAVLSHVLATATNPQQVLAEAARILKPGGRLFILNHFTPEGFPGRIDALFQPFGNLLKFRSVFREEDLALPPRLFKTGSQSFWGGYFRLLEYQLQGD